MRTLTLECYEYLPEGQIKKRWLHSHSYVNVAQIEISGSSDIITIYIVPETGRKLMQSSDVVKGQRVISILSFTGVPIFTLGTIIDVYDDGFIVQWSIDQNLTRTEHFTFGFDMQYMEVYRNSQAV